MILNIAINIRIDKKVYYEAGHIPTKVEKKKKSVSVLSDFSGNRRRVYGQRVHPWVNCLIIILLECKLYGIRTLSACFTHCYSPCA